MIIRGTGGRLGLGFLLFSEEDLRGFVGIRCLFGWAWHGVGTGISDSIAKDRKA